MQNWRNSLMVRREWNWKRFNWSLHSVVGIWTLAFVLVWGVTGIFVVFPKPFETAVNLFAPLNFYRLDLSTASADKLTPPRSATAPLVPRGNRREAPIERTLGDKILRWLYYLHFGNFAGSGVKTVWVVFGLAPVVLFVTGFLMWWNRVLSKAFAREPAADLQPNEIESMG